MLAFGSALAGPVNITPSMGNREATPGPGPLNGAPSLDFNFVANPTLDPRITFTRSSTANYFDATGTLQSAATNTPRIDYGPTVFTTNQIRNSTMVGAAAGTPGTFPTNWNIFGTIAGITRTLATGNENGIPYVEVGVSGTAGASGTITIRFESATFIVASLGQPWTASAYLKSAVGSVPSGTISRLWGTNNVGSQTEVSDVAYQDTTAALGTVRQTNTRTLSGGTTAFVFSSVEVPIVNGVAYSFTLRIGAPQLELGTVANKWIPTSTVALSAPADSEGVTNWIHNSTMVGAVVGSPGTYPTAWAISSPQNGLSRAIIGTGTEGGHPYIDVRMSGVATATTAVSLDLDGATGIIAQNNQTLALATDLTLSGGSFAGVNSIILNIVARDSTGSLISGGVVGQSVLPNIVSESGSNLTASRFSVSGTPVNSLIRFVVPRISVNVTSGAAVDFTLRIGAPQLELGAVANTWVPTSGVAANVGAVPLGLLIEEARTNSIRNPRCEGAVALAGTPAKIVATMAGGIITGLTIVDGGSGYTSTPTITFLGATFTTTATATATVSGGVVNSVTLTGGGTGYNVVPWITARLSTFPTNWATSAGNIVGSGVESGIPYVDVRVLGNGVGYADCQFDTLIATAAQGQTWTLSSNLRVIAGSWTNLASSLIIYGTPGFNDNNSTPLTSNITSAPLASQRFKISWTFTQAGTVGASARITFTPSGGDFDITLRIGAPQLELGGIATSLILPVVGTPAAATRTADVPFVSGSYSFATGSVVGEAQIMSQTNNSYFAELSDGTANNRYVIRTLGPSNALTISGGVSQPTVVIAGSVSVGVPAKLGMSFGSGTTSGCLNGGTVASQSVTPPVGSGTKLSIGAFSGGTTLLNGYMRRLRYWPRTLSNAELQVATS